MIGSEPVRIGDEVVGRVTSGGFGYTLGRSIAYAYLPIEAGPGTAVEIDLFGEWVGATVHREPLFDPRGRAGADMTDDRGLGHGTSAVPLRGVARADRPPAAIGLTTYREPAAWGVWNEPADLLPASYADGVRAAGGVALLLPPGDPARRRRSRSTAVARAAARRRRRRRPGALRRRTRRRDRPAAADRDAWELALARAAIARDLPVLAVCRGMQVLNVALGGNLRQHLPDDVGTELHCPTVGVHGRHAVAAGARLGAGRDVRRPGRRRDLPPPVGRPARRGLVATGWADDGVVEAVELRGPRLGRRRAVASRGLRRRAAVRGVRGRPADRARRSAAVRLMSVGNVEALWARTVFSPVPVRNAFEVTVERLAQAIRLGVLVDGDRLPPERELAETFGVSRMTLREAIKALRDAQPGRVAARSRRRHVRRRADARAGPLAREDRAVDRAQPRGRARAAPGGRARRRRARRRPAP